MTAAPWAACKRSRSDVVGLSYLAGTSCRALAGRMLAEICGRRGYREGPLWETQAGSGLRQHWGSWRRLFPGPLAGRLFLRYCLKSQSHNDSRQDLRHRTQFDGIDTRLSQKRGSSEGPSRVVSEDPGGLKAESQWVPSIYSINPLMRLVARHRETRFQNEPGVHVQLEATTDKDASVIRLHLRCRFGLRHTQKSRVDRTTQSIRQAPPAVTDGTQDPVHTAVLAPAGWRTERTFSVPPPQSHAQDMFHVIRCMIPA